LHLPLARTLPMAQTLTTTSAHTLSGVLASVLEIDTHDSQISAKYSNLQ